MSGVARVDRASMLRLATAIGFAALCCAATVSPATAQFSWFGRGDSSVQDAYDTISSHGFRLTGPLLQNGDVYIADVVDRKQRRQRLIISRESGQIVQRYLVDVGRSGPYAALPGTEPAPQRRSRSGSDFFSRMVRGFDDDPAPRPPADVGLPDRPEAVEPRIQPRAPQRTAKPRPSDIEPGLAARREETPVTSRPLDPGPAVPAPASTPATGGATSPAPPASPVANVPPAAAPQAAPPARATVVTTDPLRIPGVKDADTPKAATVAAKPATPPRAKPDVQVAPLD